MPVNPHFNFTTFTTEQGLVEDLIIEAIQIYGKSVYYLPREAVNIDDLFGEDTLSKYPHAYEIEVYLKSSMQMQGASETLSKFGLVISDQATFLVATKRFNQVLGLAGRTRPLENDLIFIEMQSPVAGGTTKRYMFEIKFVEDKEQLFQLGKLYTYEMQCELWNYNNEKVATGNTAVDNIATSQAYTESIQFASGSGAFQVGESIYQGGSFVAAVATAVVNTWDANTNTLVVSSVTGNFNGNDAVTGVTSGAVYTPSEAPSTIPSEPLADNDTLTQEAPDVVVPTTNPRFS